MIVLRRQAEACRRDSICAGTSLDDMMQYNHFRYNRVCSHDINVQNDTSICKSNTQHLKREHASPGKFVAMHDEFVRTKITGRLK